MRTDDKLSQNLSGQVKITEINRKTGEQIEHVYKNLVVNSCYNALAELFSGNVGSYYASYVLFGTGTTPPAIADTALQSPLAPSVQLDVTPSFPVSRSVLLSAEWDETETNVNEITEIGLFALNNTLLARRVFSPMIKSDGWAWLIEWELTYNLY